MDSTRFVMSRIVTTWISRSGATLLVVLLLVALLMVGCDQRTRPVGAGSTIPTPNTTSGPLVPGVATTQGGVPTKNVVAEGGERWVGPGVSWMVPQGWAQQGPSGMRFATLRKGALELSVTPLIASGVAENVNRWRGQIGLAEAGPAQMAEIVETLAMGNVTASFVAMAGDKDAIIGGIVPRGEQTLFFKLMGETDAVMSEADTVREFMKSIQFQ